MLPYFEYEFFQRDSMIIFIHFSKYSYIGECTMLDLCKHERGWIRRLFESKEDWKKIILNRLKLFKFHDIEIL